MVKAGSKKYRIGVISDTHGWIPDNLKDFLKRVDLIIHAGDIDNKATFKLLNSLGSVTAVRGNMDRGGWTKDLRPWELVEVGETALYVVHDIHDLDMDPASVNVKAVISGHTHRPSIFKKGAVLFINPGSAAFPRSGHPATVAVLDIENSTLSVRLMEISK